MASKSKSGQRNGRFRPISRAYKPGSKMEYFAKHPEEVDAFLRENGVDLDEWDRILAQGGGELPIGDLALPPDQRKAAKARRRQALSAD